MISKYDLIKLFKKEFATTVKVMRAYPEGKLEFRPHERSSEARKLMSTFIFELDLMAGYALGEILDREKFKTYKPETVPAVISDFEKRTKEILEKLEHVSDEDLARIVEFGGAKFPADEFMLMMLLDQIHHRGQLSVYVRMAGGKVPSIYGPSADDPGTNL
jgi:uncharacterized damage-inducible protein DinB